MKTSFTPLLAPKHRQFLARLLLVVLCLGSVAESVHAWLVPHIACLEHGETIHLSAESRASSGLKGPRYAGRFEPGSHEHEHCGLFTLSRKRRETVSPSPVVLASLAASRFSPVGLERQIFFAAKVPRFRLAPKNSPPV